jgi:cytochrome c biogenesis protein CcdA/glutaredoxin
MQSKIMLLVLALVLLAPAASAVDILFFWGDGCPYCEMQKPFLEYLTEEYPEVTVHSYEVYRSQENQALYRQTAAEHGARASGVPATFIGERHWIGWTPAYGEQMEAEVQRQLAAQDIDQTEDGLVYLPILGAINPSQVPFLATTVVIAFVDGFNPCSLWLLTFLLGVLVLARSRKKMILVGLTFLTVTAAAYGAFMLGLFSVFALAAHAWWVRWVVGIMAFLFALVNIKDYFWYKKGLSFTISDDHKPRLFERMRNIMHPQNSTPAMMGATAILALAVTLVELPCTAGFPVLWSSIAAGLQLPWTSFALFFAVYLLIYLGVEIMILVAAVISMDRFSFTEKHGRVLKLVGGVLMLVLALSFVFFWEAMNTFEGLLRLIGVAAALIIITLLLHRKILPKMGVRIGSEDLEEKR